MAINTLGRLPSKRMPLVDLEARRPSHGQFNKLGAATLHEQINATILALPTAPLIALRIDFPTSPSDPTRDSRSKDSAS